MDTRTPAYSISTNRKRPFATKARGIRRRNKHVRPSSNASHEHIAALSFSPGRVQDIDQIRRGFITAVWRKCLKKRTVSLDKGHLVFSILYHNNRHSLDLLAPTEEICLQWIHGLEYLLQRYRSHLRTHHEITDQWLWHLFCSADRDHSGHLSRREVRGLLHSLNLQLSDHELEEYFNQANIRASNQDEVRHLDNGEFLIFYKYVSYRPELLKIICR